MLPTPPAALSKNAALTAPRMATAMALILGLSACGGGGGADIASTPPATRPAPTTPTAPTAPTAPSTEISSLIAFAADGGALTQLQGGITRQTRTFTSNGTPGVVAVDRLAGTDVGLVQYRLGSDVFLYSLTGSPVGTASLPTGNFFGPLALNYRFDQNSGWSVMTGDANLHLDMTTGTVLLGGIATDNVRNLELFGEAALVNGRFETNGATLRLRDAPTGMFIRDEVGTVTGIASSQDGNHAVFGTLSGANPTNGFQLNGGFAAGVDP